ncbi:MAG: SDR family NAD(P)-dependent oxidoreductase, partial [Treponema sp.]|nr:SDR family NAD(P)-dependent oxidoreductase [Treponema sp.]
MKKLTIVTGAGSGIGKEFALQLSQRLTSTDDELWLIARSQDKLQTVKTQIQSEKPSLAVKCIPLDLTGTSGAVKFNSILVEFKKTENFTISCLVNNAGFGIFG